MHLLCNKIIGFKLRVYCIIHGYYFELFVDLYVVQIKNKDRKLIV